MSIIFGAGGVASELAWILDDLIRGGADVSRPEAFVVPDAEWRADLVHNGLPVVAESEALDRLGNGSGEVYLAVGIPSVRRRIHAAIMARGGCRFPNTIPSGLSMDRRPRRVRLGEGIVLYPRASLTTDITLGDFVQVNPGATIAHGCSVGAFTTVCPGAHLSGDVTVGEGCFIGSGAVIRENVDVAAGCTIGAGCVVVAPIREPGTWVGVPARKLEP